jgi:hypothetical protein
MELGFIITFALVVIVDNLLIYKTDYSSLSIFITKCYYSKKYKWLAYNLWGDDSGFYKKVNESIKAN